MEEKESTFSGSSPGNSETESPPPITSSMEAAAAAERSFVPGIQAIAMTATPGSGGGGTGTGTGTGSSGDLVGRKRRGRPRKYDSDGNLRVGYYNNNKQQLGAGGPPPPPGFSLSTSSPPSDFSSMSKRGRGRLSGSGNWQLIASLGEIFANTAGGDFTPHVVTVNTGEDVAGKVISFSQKGNRGVCVLSANGAVSNVTIRQPGSSGGILTYEGRFEILSLSGSFTVIENSGMRSRTGGLSVSLAGPDGRVIGGGVAGLLLAASPIQIVVGSFMPNGYKAHKRKYNREQPVSTPPLSLASAAEAVTAATPISQANPDSRLWPGPTNNGGGAAAAADDSDKQNSLNALPANNAASSWIGPEPLSGQRPSPDINVSISCGE